MECLLLTQATDMEAVILFGGPDRTARIKLYQIVTCEVGQPAFHTTVRLFGASVPLSCAFNVSYIALADHVNGVPSLNAMSAPSGVGKAGFALGFAPPRR